MTEMTLKEAIEYLKERVAKLKKWKEDGDLTEAIDTVVEEVEKPLPTDDEIIEKANEAYPGEEIVPHFQRIGFTFGAKWIRNFMERRQRNETY